MFPPAWVVGTAGLSVAKILENMEIGHNILHGQWDWMRDPKIHSTTWEWDSATPGRAVEARAQRAAPQLHQRDRQGQRPRLRHHARRRGPAAGSRCTSAQPLWNFVNALLLRVRHRGVRPRAAAAPRPQGATKDPKFQRELKAVLQQDPPPGDQGLRRPPAAVAATGSFLHHARRNFTANTGAQPVVALGDHVRPLPRGRPDLREALDRRRDQAASGTCARCSARPTSPARKLMHIMTGNLSHQIEHHLFPDLPSNRYGEIAPKVQDLFDRYGLDYCAAPAAAAGLLRLAQGGPAVAAQRLARPDHAAQPARPAQAALPDDHRWPEGPPPAAERRLAVREGPLSRRERGPFFSGAWRSRPGRTGAGPAPAGRGCAAWPPARARRHRRAPGRGPAPAVTSTAP